MEGLNDKEWREVLDRYIAERKMSADAHERMSDVQRWCIKQIDLSIARIKYKMEHGQEKHN